MHGFLAGAFDRFANAHALACELHSCGFDDANVRITGNPSNPDAMFGVSLSSEIARFPGLLQICFSNLFEFGDSPARGPSLDALREGGIVVSVCVTDRDEAEIARRVLPPLRADANDAIHVLQHTFFFVSALVFWWVVFGNRTRTVELAALAMLFTTMLHTGALGLLLTFSPRPWYPQEGPGLFGWTALEDQQFGGLIMWVPGSLAYLIAGLTVAASCLLPARAGRSMGIDVSE